MRKLRVCGLIFIFLFVLTIQAQKGPVVATPTPPVTSVPSAATPPSPGITLGPFGTVGRVAITNPPFSVPNPPFSISNPPFTVPNPPFAVSNPPFAFGNPLQLTTPNPTV